MLKKKFALIMMTILLGGCNGSNDNSQVIDVVDSVEKLKDTAKDVIDNTTGITYRQIDIKENSDITITLNSNDKIFELKAGVNNSNPEKMIVSG
ncbi:hypothetical protein, partial [Photobacterium phosphoreum]|uniref:hypothetical protein n=1 Tax=Photobacterium phosphoreum TaxID=659 RepID=UPI000D15A560